MCNSGIEHAFLLLKHDRRLGGQFVILTKHTQGIAEDLFCIINEFVLNRRPNSRTNILSGLLEKVMWQTSLIS
jgi:hypothetical protein